MERRGPRVIKREWRAALGPFYKGRRSRVMDRGMRDVRQVDATAGEAPPVVDTGTLSVCQVEAAGGAAHGHCRDVIWSKLFVESLWSK